MEKEAGILPWKYPDLHMSAPVKHANLRALERGEIGIIKNDPDFLISTYLNRFGKIFDTETPQPKKERRVRFLKRELHEMLVIKPEDVPESYFNLQRRIAREQGHGDIQITQEVKRKMAQTIQIDQTKSLDLWIDYLGSADASYPNWFKYYAFRSIVGLSSYDAEKKKFGKRARYTAALFPEINYEALSNVYSKLNKSHIQKVRNEDPNLESMLEKANFAQLYAYEVEQLSPISSEDKKETDGEWIKYDQDSDPKLLSASLQGHGRGTGWCTAGEETASVQLKTGDFYVFYSQDKTGFNTIPRIAIRMQHAEIAEVRGINPNQELEPALIDIAEAKMEGLSGAEKYKKKTHDMKLLTAIEQKTNQDILLTPDEVRFLYEIDYRIEGFGISDYIPDPRIQEICEKRDKRQDFAIMFGCLPDEVAFTKDELSDHTVALVSWLGVGGGSDPWETMPTNLVHIQGDAGGFIYRSQMSSLENLETISGSVDFGKTRVRSLGKLRHIGGNVHFHDSQITDLGELKSIGGFAWFGDGSQLETLGNLESIGGSATFDHSRIIDLGELISIGSWTIMEDSRLRNLGKLERIGGEITIDQSTLARLDFSKVEHGNIKIREEQDWYKGMMASRERRNKEVKANP